MTAVERTDGCRYGAMEILDCVRRGVVGLGSGDWPKRELELATGMLLGHELCPRREAPRGIGEVMRGTGLAAAPWLKRDWAAGDCTWKGGVSTGGCVSVSGGGACGGGGWRRVEGSARWGRTDARASGRTTIQLSLFSLLPVSSSGLSGRGNLSLSPS